MKTSLAQGITALSESIWIEGIRIGKIVNIDEGEKVWINFADNRRGPIEARFTQSVGIESLRYAEKNKQEILVVFENNDSNLPIIIDLISSETNGLINIANTPIEAEKPEEVFLDGKKMVFDARDEIVLRCGKSSITLTKAGKVLIRGTYLLNRSSGVNKIKGGSVQIN